MCFIQVGHFGKYEKKVKKTSTPLTSEQISTFCNVLLHKTGLSKTFEMIGAYVKPKSLVQSMYEDEIRNKPFYEKL